MLTTVSVLLVAIQALIDCVPVQYERLFDTSRIPGKDCDTLVHYEDVQKYVAVSRRVSVFPARSSSSAENISSESSLCVFLLHQYFVRKVCGKRLVSMVGGFCACVHDRLALVREMMGVLITLFQGNWYRLLMTTRAKDGIIRNVLPHEVEKQVCMKLEFALEMVHA